MVYEVLKKEQESYLNKDFRSFMIDPDIGSGRELNLHSLACSGYYRPQLTITLGIIDIGLIRQNSNKFGIAWTLNPSKNISNPIPAKPSPTKD